MKATESVVLSSFKLKVCDIESVDLQKLHALSLSVRWPHRAEDWKMLREVGHGIVAMDDIERVLGSAMWFEYGTSFATIGMVITSPRLQAYGGGRWMMAHVLKELGSRNLGLNATRAARRLYLSLGFTPENLIYQYQGQVLEPPPAVLPAATMLRELEPADLKQIATLDRKAFGADRSALLARLLEISKGVALLRGKKIQAFAICRPFGRGSVVGPVVATTDDDAVAVTRPHLAENAGKFLRIDTRQQGAEFPELLASSGLSVYDTVTTMSRGRAWTSVNRKPSRTQPIAYALASHTLG